MWISNNILRVGLCFALANMLRADDLSLAGGDVRLTGTVTSIGADGVVELSSPLSPEPLKLKSGVVRKVLFSPEEALPEPPPALVELSNGDLIPAVVESLDDKKLVIISPEAGRMEIPRDALTSLQLGIHRRKVVYVGPRNLDEWSGPDGDLKNWTFQEKSLIANGPASAAKKMNLPRQFILRFTFKWQAKVVPNFEVSFADPLKPKGEASDRYFLRFNSAGLGVKREASKGKHYTDILLLNRTPNQYPNHELDIEIRVDRNTSRLKLLLNGEPEGEFIDHIPAVPTGSGISFVCNGQSGSPQEIRGIEISELDDARVRHRAEERGDPKADSLISREDDRWGGKLLDIRKSGAGVLFRFKSDFQNDPLEIPEADVSTVFFAGKDGAGKTDGKHPFLLRLRGEGSLRVSSCQFTPDEVTAEHPLLGSLKLRRRGIVALERTDLIPQPDPEP